MQDPGCRDMLCNSATAIPCHRNSVPSCPSTHLPICPSAHLSICPSAHLPICPSAHLSICPPAPSDNFRSTRLLLLLLACRVLLASRAASTDHQKNNTSIGRGRAPSCASENCQVQHVENQQSGNLVVWHLALWRLCALLTASPPITRRPSSSY